MAVVDLYSKRQKRARGEMPDVYVYDEIPQGLRVQIVQIWYETIGGQKHYRDASSHYSNGYGTYDAYKWIAETLCREYGQFSLIDTSRHDPRDYLEELISFLCTEQDTERVLDVIELSFRAIDVLTRDSQHLHRERAGEIADGAIAELNTRFQEHGVGYKYEQRQIVRVDSEFIHQEVVKPALRVLEGEGYQGAQEEFLRAHEHYRKGNAKEALNEAHKAFESTLKIVCQKRGWPVAGNATAGSLVNVCFEKGLIRNFWQGHMNHMNQLKSTLKSGIPPARNMVGAHGQGAEPTEVPEYIVAYVLHMTASAIVFLAAAEQAHDQ